MIIFIKDKRKILLELKVRMSDASHCFDSIAGGRSC
jgi:hypothetical protein